MQLRTASGGLNIITSMIERQGTNGRPIWGYSKGFDRTNFRSMPLSRNISFEYSSTPPIAFTYVSAPMALHKASGRS